MNRDKLRTLLVNECQKVLSSIVLSWRLSQDEKDVLSAVITASGDDAWVDKLLGSMPKRPGGVP